mmetsp:Transcript_42272/g.61954  ORF Transcript_42272/g.61954 Transcript_42272/m.61954 type:complete len:158 (-) Transcript_42272:8-481(-)
MYYDDLALLMLISDAEGYENQSYRQKLRKQGQLRRRNRLTRLATSMPSASAWVYLLHSGCDQSFISITGFDYTTFHLMLPHFNALYNKFAPYSKDGFILKKIKKTNKRLLTGDACLGLVLCWTKSWGNVNTLYAVLASHILPFAFSCIFEYVCWYSC